MPDRLSTPPLAPDSASPSWRYRLGVLSRTGAALLGGYGVAHASTALLTVILPMERINRVVTASLLSFVFWCAAAVWVFAARNAWRAWWPLLLGNALMLGAALFWRESGMRP